MYVIVCFWAGAPRGDKGSPRRRSYPQSQLSFRGFVKACSLRMMEALGFYTPTRTGAVDERPESQAKGMYSKFPNECLASQCLRKMLQKYFSSPL